MPWKDGFRRAPDTEWRNEPIPVSSNAWEQSTVPFLDRPRLSEEEKSEVAITRAFSYHQAEAAVRQALQADPNMPHLLNTMGELLMTRGSYGEALKYFLAAIERDPDTSSRYWNAALAFEKTGQYDKAYDYAGRFSSLAADPEQRQRAQMYMDMLQNRYFPKR